LERQDLLADASVAAFFPGDEHLGTLCHPRDQPAERLGAGIVNWKLLQGHRPSKGPWRLQLLWELLAADGLQLVVGQCERLANRVREWPPVAQVGQYAIRDAARMSRPNSARSHSACRISGCHLLPTPWT
jgi:hypothetical protein